ncbi:hypothetical protein G6F45_014097 [Rhizopus arrhizus]|nr:hypothetical protein G6F23_015116 [Rhizopus arrhizus]KAG1605936.1 hypothetical protein G6F45_014097 [Rhizopus arrhizus]
MPQAAGVHLAPAGRIRQRAVAHHVMRHLRRHGVQHVERLLHARHTAVGALHIEPGLARRPVHRHQRGIERQVDAIALDIAHQRRHERGHAEQRRARQVEFHMHAV